MTFIVFLLLLLLPVTTQATVLSDAADAMAPDSWVILSTLGISCSTLLEVPGCNDITSTSTGNITSDATRGCWDPVGQQMHFTGQGHTAGSSPMRHVVYDAATNTWLRLADPFPAGGVQHNFNYQSCDSRGRKLYRGRIGGTNLWMYNFANPAAGFVDLAIGNGGLDPSAFAGFTFHRDRGATGQVLAVGRTSPTTGNLLAYSPESGAWTTVAANLAGFGDSNAWMEYSDIHKVTMFGYSNVMSQITTRGAITSAASLPGCGTSANRDGIVHADPATGNMVLLCGAGTASWSIYNPITNTWTTKAAPSTISAHILNFPSAPGGPWPTWGAIGAPIWDHGVIMYVKCNDGGACQVSLYKGGAFSAADRDFKRRCHAPGVITCVGFDSINDVNGSTVAGVSRFPAGATTPVLQAGVVASGLQAIDMTVPAVAGADTSGAWNDNFRDDMSQQRDAGGEVYVQFRWRATPCFLFTGANDAECFASTTPRDFTGGNGPKISIVGQGDRPGVPAFSCSDQETVIETLDGSGFPKMYRSCAGPFAFNGLYEPFNGGVNNFVQNANRSTVAATGCFYPGPYTGCVKYVANEWLTFQLRIKVSTPWFTTGGTFVHNGIVQLWVARENQPSTLVLDFSQKGNTTCDTTQSYIPGSAGTSGCQTGLDFWRSSVAPDNANLLGKVWLLPYNTGRSASFSYPVAHVYYDELIVSTALIPDPGAPPAPVDTTPPSIPTGLTAQAISSSQVNLSWTASTDNVGVTAYIVRRGGLQIGAPSSTSFSDTTALPSTTYGYTVAARDAAGNVSAASSSVSVTTPAPSAPNAPIAAYKLDVDASDAAGNGHTGTVSGATFVAGQFGQAANFAGSTNVISLANGSPTLANLGPLSICAWINPSSFGGNGAGRIYDRANAIEYSLVAGASVTPVAYDNSTPSLNNVDVSSVSFSHTTAGSNRALVVFVAMNGTGQTVSSITYNSVPLTFFNALTLTGSLPGRLEVWVLSAPASGANPVVVTLSASNAQVDIVAESFTGAHQTTAFLATSWQTAQNGGGETALTTASVISATGDMVIAGTISTTNNGTTSGSGQTQRWQDNAGLVNTQGSTKAGPSTTMTETWDFSSGNNTHGVAAFNINQAAGVASVSSMTFTVVYADGSTVQRTAPTGTIALSTAQHVCVTWDGGVAPSGIRLYRSGVEVASYQDERTATGARVNDAASVSGIGNRTTDLARGFVGWIDNVRIWNSAISAEQVTADMTSPVGQPAYSILVPDADRTLAARPLVSDRSLVTDRPLVP